MATSLKDLYFEQIKDLFDAESRLVEAIPKMVDQATSPELQRGLGEHWQETKVHVSRLKTIFENHGMKPERETCKAMKGLVAEAESEMEQWKTNAAVRDAAIIAGGQRIEHYEMSGYGTARSYAEMLGFEDDMELLATTLEEEKSADAKLNDIALGSVNRDALLANPSLERTKHGGHDHHARR